MTIAVDKEEAEKVLYGQSNGELAFALLTDDSTVRPGPGVTAGTLFQ
jgi:pilus assembly protein CpaB